VPNLTNKVLHQWSRSRGAGGPSLFPSMAGPDPRGQSARWTWARGAKGHKARVVREHRAAAARHADRIGRPLRRTNRPACCARPVSPSAAGRLPPRPTWPSRGTDGDRRRVPGRGEASRARGHDERSNQPWRVVE
jgi:hypothetical protein